MRVGFLPFYSQQSKRTGLFLQRTCGNVKQLAYLAHALQMSGVYTAALAPRDAADITPFPAARCAWMPIQNPLQRLHWDLQTLERCFDDCDVIVTNSEYMAIPLRKLFLRKRLIQMCNVAADSELFKPAWQAADLVVAQGQYAAGQIQLNTNTRTTFWPLAYVELDFAAALPLQRDIDVVFLQRCSADNSTHHEDYLRTMQHRTVFTDVTCFLRKQRGDLEYSTPKTYIETLHRSRVAVSMHRSWYGGMSIREAIRAGCVPVTLRTPAYEELLGPKWPYYCTPASVESAVYRALWEPAPQLPDVRGESFQAGCAKALKDIRASSTRRA